MAGIVLYCRPQNAVGQNPVDIQTLPTLHALFDKGIDADFSRGDATTGLLRRAMKWGRKPVIPVRRDGVIHTYF